MKYVLTIFVLLIYSVAHAQTPVSKETANAYFSNCIKIPPREQFSQESQNMFCACTAARMTQFYTMEDWNELVNRGPKMREADNKMLIYVAAPCLETSTREHYYNTCIADPNSARYGNPQKVCSCLGNALGVHVQAHGPEIFQQILATNPDISDPMEALTNDPSFQTFAQSKLLACLQ